MLPNYELQKKVEDIIRSHLHSIHYIHTYRMGGVFAEVIGDDGVSLEEFNVSKIAKEIVEELYG